MNSLKLAPISMSERAIAEIQKEKSRLKESRPIRIGAVSGGCSGYSYILKFDTATSADERFEIKDLNVIIDKEQLSVLNGLSVDYQSGLDNRGFVYNNPNASTTCGCGNSFG